MGQTAHVVARLDDDDWQVQASAVKALGTTGEAEHHSEALIASLEHGNFVVRLNAMKILSSIHPRFLVMHRPRIAARVEDLKGRDPKLQVIERTIMQWQARVVAWACVCKVSG